MERRGADCLRRCVRGPESRGGHRRCSDPSDGSGEEQRRIRSDSWPQFLPDGAPFPLPADRPVRVLAEARRPISACAQAVIARKLVSGVFNALFVAPDRILFTDANGIKAQRVDLDRGQMTGDIASSFLRTSIAISATRRSPSREAARSPMRRRVHAIIASSGSIATDTKRESLAAVDGWRDVALSPDGLRVAVQRIVTRRQ